MRTIELTTAAPLLKLVERSSSPGFEVLSVGTPSVNQWGHDQAERDLQSCPPRVS